jgi:hypothetical protein
MKHNVADAGGKPGIPKVYEQDDPQLGEGVLHRPVMPPTTIERQMKLASGKAKMRFIYQPQMADKHTAGPDSGQPDPKDVGSDREGGADQALHNGGGGGGKKGRIKHRSTGGSSITGIPSGA